MRILLLGEYSNVHATLAEGLRCLGHEVVVASNGDFWKNYPRDIDLKRHDGPLAGLRLWMKVMANLHKFSGFDIVQIINPMFLELKAGRHFKILDYLIRHNRKLVLCAMGMDYYWVHENITRKPLRYGDFNIGNELRTNEEAMVERNDWVDTDKQRLNIICAEKADAIVTGLYEYDVCYRPNYPDKTTFIPLPIKMERLSDEVYEHLEGNKIKVFIGISKNRSAYKGTDIMLQAARDVEKRFPDKIEVKVAEGIPFSEYRKMMLGSDIIMDQLYSYTPAMNALEAMSHGIICMGGGEPENYDILGETELRPIINVEPNYQSVFNALEDIIQHPEKIPELKRQSKEYIRRHHDYMKVAKQYEALYKSI